MTVGTNLHKTLACLRTEAGALETYAIETQDQQAKQTYHQCSQQLSQIVSQLESRVNQVERQEPSYKISQQSGAQMNMGNTSIMTNTTGKNKTTH